MKSSNKKKYFVIDFIIIVFLLFFIYGYYKITFGGNNSNYNTNVTYKVKVNGVSLEYIGKISKGDILYDDLNGVKMGTVEFIEYDKSYKYTFDEINHIYVKDIIDDEYVLYVDLSREIVDTYVNLYINDYDLKVGKTVDLVCDKYSLYGFIVDIVGEDNENY